MSSNYDIYQFKSVHYFIITVNMTSVGFCMNVSFLNTLSSFQQ